VCSVPVKGEWGGGRGRAGGFSSDVVVVGGCGRAGLPLAIALADRGARVAVYDASEPAVAAVSSARMPFARSPAHLRGALEAPSSLVARSSLLSPDDTAPLRLALPPSRADLMLERAVATGQLVASADPRIVRTAEHVIIAMADGDGAACAPLPSRGRHAAAPGPACGPVRREGEVGGRREAGSGAPWIIDAISDCAGDFRDRQILILRTAAGLGATAQLEKIVAELGVDADVAFCPQVADGEAVTELFDVPQIVSSRTERGLERAGRLFAMLAPVQVPMLPEEAELAALFASAWQYIRLAAANQLYMMASDRGLDFERIRRGIAVDQPSAAGLPRAGGAAGEHVLRVTAALAAGGEGFTLGRAALDVNEGLPAYLVRRLEERYDLRSLTVGILGMAEAGSRGDVPSRLAHRLRQILADRAGTVLCTDPLVSTDPALLPLEEVLARADLLVIGAPHPGYRSLVTRKPMLDIYNVRGRGVPA
jgi:UDP-N-acetyl-D-mannosaminuronic acid dehydrogenase